MVERAGRPRLFSCEMRVRAVVLYASPSISTEGPWQTARSALLATAICLIGVLKQQPENPSLDGPEIDVFCYKLAETQLGLGAQVVVSNKSDQDVVVSRWSVRCLVKHRVEFVDAEGGATRVVETFPGVGILEEPPDRRDPSDALIVPARCGVSIEFMLESYELSDPVNAPLSVRLDGPICTVPLRELNTLSTVTTQSVPILFRMPGEPPTKKP